ncbi:PIN domain-containing protein [Streptomyces sp. NPDC086838]|uniref:PIN domain-containing protein n=1 Tax=Streptomyces sp. NPDC086838 TaxID=3365762 RepID=UPI00381B2B32
MATAANNVRSGGYADAYRGLLAYLGWANDAVRTLARCISSADLDRLVLTRRHDALLAGASSGMAGSHQQALVNGLVRLELDQRVEDFDAALQELNRLVGRWPTDLHLVVADSSFFIQHPTKLELADIAEVVGAGSEPIRLLIPMPVIDELDGLKQAPKQPARYRSGYTLAVLDRILGEDPSEPGVLKDRDGEVTDPTGCPTPRGEVTVEVLYDPPGHSRLPITDDEIVDRAAAAQALAGSPVTLVTYDTGQSMRGRAAGLKVCKLRQDPGEDPAQTQQ